MSVIRPCSVIRPFPSKGLVSDKRPWPYNRGNTVATKQARPSSSSSRDDCQSEILKVLKDISRVQKERLVMDRITCDRLRDKVKTSEMLLQAQQEKMKSHQQMMEGVKKLVSTYLVGTLLEKVNL